MKKLLAVFFSFLIVFGIAGCSTQVEYEFYKGAYKIEAFTQPRTEYRIISDYLEIEAVSSMEYSQDFFDDHTLIVIMDYFPEKLTECNVKSVTKKGHKIKINMEVNYYSGISNLIVGHPTTYINFVYVEVKAKNIKEVELLGIGVEAYV